MLSQNDIELVHRFIEGKVSGEEAQRVERLLANGTLNPDLRGYFLNDWNTMLPEDEINTDYLLDRIHHLIHLKEQDEPISLKKRFIRGYSLVAAVLLVPVLLSALWFYIHDENTQKAGDLQPVVSTIMAPLGSRVSFNLPDGTTGFLNSGSTLTYSMPFSGNRSVKLRGEAWFDVMNDQLHPFQVRVDTSLIQVLGTSFNVSAYPEDKIIDVVLAEGSVAFKAKPAASPVVLKPSERLIYNGDEIKIEKTDPQKYYGWTQGKLVFRGDNMAEVARRLERWYNIEVEVASAELNDYVFRATFEDDALPEVLRLLGMTSPIRYKITPRKALSDGTWAKEKVTLFKK